MIFVFLLLLRFFFFISLLFVRTDLMKRICWLFVTSLFRIQWAKTERLYKIQNLFYIIHRKFHGWRGSMVRVLYDLSRRRPGVCILYNIVNLSSFKWQLKIFIFLVQKINFRITKFVALMNSICFLWQRHRFFSCYIRMRR